MAETKEYLVLMPVDGEHHSLQSFMWYLNHFYHKGHEIGLVNIYCTPEKPSAHIMHHGTKTELAAMAKEEYEKGYDEAIRRSHGIMFQYQQLCAKHGIKSRVICQEKTDSIGHLICKIAVDNKADCIVLGHREMSAIKRVFGSVSEHVLHHAHVPVLIVPLSKEKVSFDSSEPNTIHTCK